MVPTVVVDVDKCFQFKRRPMPFSIYHASCTFKTYLRWRIYVLCAIRDFWVHMDLDQTMKPSDENLWIFSCFLKKSKLNCF